MQKTYSLFIILTFAINSFAQVPALKPVQIGSGFTSPVDIKNCGDNRLFIVEQAGTIRIMDKNGLINSTPFLDIHSQVLSTGNEQGLLSVAFPPDFKQTRYFYVNYITGSGNGSTRISRFQVSGADSDYVSPTTEKILLQFTQPYTNHKGATLMFGPDGYLYDTQGDGGNQDDPTGNGQNTNVFLAKILRFDVSNPDTTYLIPPGNPFANDATKQPAIWAYGLRNPWRCSFDRLTGDMWIADVGQDTYEEVDFQPVIDTGGHNYGWRCREGFHACPACIQTGCPGSGFTDPIFEYVHSNTNGCSIIGGYVYRGAQWAALFGRYLFTDFCSGRFLSIQQTNPGTFHVDTLSTFLTNQYSTFGQDNNGELYIAGRVNGIIYHLTDTVNCKPVAFISIRDSLTGCAPVSISTPSGDSLTYQWYNTTGALNGATDSHYQVTQAGWYKVSVAKSGIGCQTISDSVFVTVNYPDPVTLCNCSLAFCNNQSAIPLNLFAPTGGKYYGNGIFNDSLLNGTLFNSSPDTLDQLAYIYTNALGCTSSDTVSIEIKLCTGIKDIIEKIAFDIYPNPNHGTFNLTLHYEKTLQVQLSVIDNLGKVCFEDKQLLDSSGPTIALELPWLSKGTYTLQLKGKNASGSGKFVVN